MATTNGVWSKYFAKIKMTTLVGVIFASLVLFVVGNSLISSLFSSIGLLNIGTPVVLTTVLLVSLLIVKLGLQLAEGRSLSALNLVGVGIVSTLLIVLVWFVLPSIAPSAFSFSILKMKAASMSILGL